MTFTQRALLSICLSFALACGSSGSGGSGNTTPGAGGDGDMPAGPGTPAKHPDFVGPSAAHAIGGVVTEISKGSRLSGVEVTVVGTKQAVTTDDSGQFLLADVPEGPVSLSLSKDGYAPGFAATESSDSAGGVLVSLKKEGSSHSYDSTSMATLSEKTDNGPYAVIFEAGSLDTDDTNLQVSVTPLDPTVESAALPGDLIAGGASPSPLDAVTFAEFSILDSSGKHVNLKPDASAIVELPIPLALRADYQLGSKIHCYSYDPTTAKWEDFVEGTVEVSSIDGMTPVLRASIRHFSWYGGAPDVQDQGCVVVQVFSAYSGRPLAGATVTAAPGLNAVTNADGVALITVKKDAKIKYTAVKTYTDTYVDDKGNLIPQDGSVVLELGRVEPDETLTPLTDGPCDGSQDTSNKSKRLRIDTGPLGNGTYGYTVTGILVSGQAEVIVERGLIDESGEPQDSMPVTNAIVTVTSSDGKTVTLGTFAAAGGVYLDTSGGMALTGQRYTIDVDVDGNGSVDTSSSCVIPGDLAWIKPKSGATYDAATFSASWSDSNAGQRGYSPIYYASLSPATDGVLSGGYYAGPELSFTPDPPLLPGDYNAVLETLNNSGTFTGVDIEGQLTCLTVATVDTTFTIR